MMISWGNVINLLNLFNILSKICRQSIRKDIWTLKDFCCVLYILDFYYLGSLLGVTLESHVNSRLMYQQRTTPVLIWSNLILD